MLFAIVSLTLCVGLSLARSIAQCSKKEFHLRGFSDPSSVSKGLTKRSLVEQCPPATTSVVHRALEDVTAMSMACICALRPQDSDKGIDAILQNQFFSAEINDRARHLIRGRFEGVLAETCNPDEGWATLLCAPENWPACHQNAQLAFDTRLGQNRLYLVSPSGSPNAQCP